MDNTIAESTKATSDPSRLLIEIGVIIAGPLDLVDGRAVRMAVQQADQRLRELHPGFTFDFFEIRRPEMNGTGRVEPSQLLRQALEQRDAKHWDFAFVLTAAELAGKYSTYCFAALSRPLDAAVVSLMLIDPQALGVVADAEERVHRIARRLSRLMLHALGHLTGLPESDHPNDLMFHPPEAPALDLMAGLSEQDLEAQRRALVEIADPRLEERGKRSMNPLLFAVRAAWINRRVIARSIWAAQPWQFPRRLSRLTIASFSTLAILIMTAEAWDLALAQEPRSGALLVLGTWFVSTLYVVFRQQLLLRRRSRRTEQSIVTSASALGTVFCGMVTTWLALFVAGAAVAYLLFPADLIANWSTSTITNTRSVQWHDRPQMAAIAASLGLIIGALGASFESESYFRHVIFVDEEI